MSNINILIFTTEADSCSMLFLLYTEEHLPIVLHDLLVLLSSIIESI